MVVSPIENLGFPTTVQIRVARANQCILAGKSGTSVQLRNFTSWGWV